MKFLMLELKREERFEIAKILFQGSHQMAPRHSAERRSS
jgi:hypothetical protein